MALLHQVSTSKNLLSQVNNMGKTIKEVFGLEPLPEDHELAMFTPYLDFPIENLNVEVVEYMVMYGLYLDTFIPLAIEMISKDPKIGHSYDFSLLVNLARVNIPELKKYAEKIEKLVSTLEAYLHSVYDKLNKLDKEDLVDSIKVLEESLN